MTSTNKKRPRTMGSLTKGKIKMKRLYLYVNGTTVRDGTTVHDGELVDLSALSEYLKDNIEHWIAEVYTALGGEIE